jgi:hypothetical protein
LPRSRFGLESLSSPRLVFAKFRPNLGLAQASTLAPLLSSRLGLDSFRFGINSASPRARFGLAYPGLASPCHGLTSVSRQFHLGLAAPLSRLESPSLASALALPRRGLVWPVLASPSESASPSRISASRRPRLASSPPLSGLGLSSFSPRPRLVLASPHPVSGSQRLQHSLRLASASPRPRFGIASASLRLVASSPPSGLGLASFSPRPRLASSGLGITTTSA